MMLAGSVAPPKPDSDGKPRSTCDATEPDSEDIAFIAWIVAATNRSGVVSGKRGFRFDNAAA
ncbi:MAG: hypothetical protein E6G68_10550, partial [Actinobacteria bacterium]